MKGTIRVLILDYPPARNWGRLLVVAGHELEKFVGEPSSGRFPLPLREDSSGACDQSEASLLASLNSAGIDTPFRTLSRSQRGLLPLKIFVLDHLT